MRAIVLLFMICVIPVSVFAQGDPNDITIAPINYGTETQDIITEAYFYDWWLLNLNAGDSILVTMTGQEGLAPLIGLLDANQNLVERSEDGTPNDTVTLTYTASEAGEYRIVATRVGNKDGTTVGRYTIQVEDITEAPVEVDPYREVVFDCMGEEASNVLTIQMRDDPDQTKFVSVSVYGLDGFDPVLRTTLNFDFEPFFDQFCIPADGNGPGSGQGDRLRLPGEDMIVTEGGVPKTNFDGIEAFGVVHLNVGTVDDLTGRYVVVIDGFTAGRDNDRDLLELGLGPLVQESVVEVYIISDKASRLDGAIELISADGEVIRDCDDAGARDCEHVRSMEDFYWYSSEHETEVQGGRFDAGLRLEQNTPDRQEVLLGGFDGRTYGDYTIVIIGELDN